ncbi:MAG TPA: thioredoxin [Caldithrix abyssi]|uniref:Thioredoxin n=1 Tax=Caldithrix abyssi TaxID=187145 RepID=A0A7V5RNK8_CALAY|nr:thioredoxin [Caldithrix abyssi]
MIRLALTLSVLFFLAACGSELKSKKVTKDNTEMLYGKTTAEQLYFDFPVWKEAFDVYRPKKEVMAELKSVVRPMKIKIFFGTWCKDSRKNVPRFFKIIDAYKDKFEIELIAVDRGLDAENENAEAWDIQRVPTFIFIEKGQEIGRIIENPVKSLEEDVVDILRAG